MEEIYANVQVAKPVDPSPSTNQTGKNVQLDGDIVHGCMYIYIYIYIVIISILLTVFTGLSCVQVPGAQRGDFMDVLFSVWGSSVFPCWLDSSASVSPVSLVSHVRLNF